ncbi:MAG TPA: hypothetical protein VMK12_13410, partial [Anaeromyxobacteraceae bacterium]|nr:hypothetical protein [Anaeromyxobacteraceae bacterium]
MRETDRDPFLLRALHRPIGVEKSPQESPIEVRGAFLDLGRDDLVSVPDAERIGELAQGNEDQPVVPGLPLDLDPAPEVRAVRELHGRRLRSTHHRCDTGRKDGGTVGLASKARIPSSQDGDLFLDVPIADQHPEQEAFIEAVGTLPPHGQSVVVKGQRIAGLEVLGLHP